MASGAEESASAAEELASQSNVLTDMVGQFQLSGSSNKPGRSAARGPASGSRAPSRPVARPAAAKPKSNGNGHGNGNGHTSRLDAEKLLPFEDDALLTSF
jgi:hypothetical protein